MITPHSLPFLPFVQWLFPYSFLPLSRIPPKYHTFCRTPFDLLINFPLALMSDLVSFSYIWKALFPLSFYSLSFQFTSIENGNCTFFREQGNPKIYNLFLVQLRWYWFRHHINYERGWPFCWFGAFHLKTFFERQESELSWPLSFPSCRTAEVCMFYSWNIIIEHR